MGVREAVLKDLPQLCRLYFAFHQHHAERVPERLKDLGSWEHYDKTRLVRGLEEILANPSARIFVAEERGSIAGFVEIYLREDPADPATISHKYVHVQSLMVVPDLRKQGIGKRLMNAAETWAAGQGAAEIRLDSWEFSGDPVSFYEALGYRSLKRKMVRPIR